MDNLFRYVLSADRTRAEYQVIGNSRKGQEIAALKIGSGPKKISLIGGMHADEPAGPLLLRYFCGYLSKLEADHPLLKAFTWWIVPHGNPDGEVQNSNWFHHTNHLPDIGSYLANRKRELPGDDMEFGFPRNKADTEVRPENRAIYDWWCAEPEPFSLHVSLHGMGFAGGCWFLLQPESKWDLSELQKHCSRASSKLEYVLHDVERQGEKGFNRIAPGFCTHPTSKTMTAHFVELNDDSTAKLFRPSSMETICSFGGNPLTLVSEIPLFILPGVGLELGPPDPVAVQWKEQLEVWGIELKEGLSPELLNIRAEASGITPIPYDHQMQLQWALIVAGMKTVAEGEMSVIDL